jgi:MFS family permease
LPRRSIRAWWSEGESWYAAVGLANLVLGTSSILIPLALKSLLHRSVDSLGVLSSLVSVVGVLGSLAWGRFSDVAHRRKPFIVLSYAVPGACLLLMAFARTFESLILLNMVLNLFWVANASVIVLIVIENRDSRDWETKIGHLNQVGALGWLFGLLLGSAALAVGGRLVDELWALRATFALIGVGGLAAAALAARSVPSTRAREVEASPPAPAVALGSALVDLVLLGPIRRFDARRLGRQLRGPGRKRDLAPGTKPFLAATLVAYLGLGLFGIPLPLLLAERFLLPSSVVFLFFAIQCGAVVAAYPWASRRIRETGNLRVHRSALAIRLALFATAAAYLALTRRIPPVPLLVVAFIVYGLTWSTFQLSGTAITSRFARTEARGRALGLYNGLAGSGWILAGVGSGYLASWAGYQASFGAAALCLVLALVMLRFVPEPEAGGPATGGQTPRDLPPRYGEQPDRLDHRRARA